MKKIIYWTLPISMLIVQFLISSIFAVVINQDFDAINGIIALIILFLPLLIPQSILLLLTGYCYISIMAAIKDNRYKWFTTIAMWIVWVAICGYFFFFLTTPTNTENTLWWTLLLIAYLLPLTIATIKLRDNTQTN